MPALRLLSNEIWSMTFAYLDPPTRHAFSLVCKDFAKCARISDRLQQAHDILSSQHQLHTSQELALDGDDQNDYEGQEDVSFDYEEAGILTEAEAEKLLLEEESLLETDAVRLQPRDETGSVGLGRKMRNERDAMVNDWVEDFLIRRIKMISTEAKDLAEMLSKKVKNAVVASSSRTFKINKHGHLVKTFAFRGSIRDQMLGACPSGIFEVSSAQFIDVVLAIMLENCSKSFRLRLEEWATDATEVMSLEAILEELPRARGRFVDGVYVRFVSQARAKQAGLRHNYGPYIGMSSNIGLRQHCHDSSTGVNHLVRQANLSIPARDWSVGVLVDFGFAKLSEVPPPVGNMIESILIAVTGTLFSANPTQVNLYDRRGFNVKKREAEKNPESELLAVCITAWDQLRQFYHADEQHRPILPPRSILSDILWTRRLAPVLFKHPTVSVTLALMTMFSNREVEDTEDLDRRVTIRAMRRHQKAHPIPESAFALADPDRIFTEDGEQGGKRFLIAKRHPTNPYPQDSYRTLADAFKSAIQDFDKYVDAQGYAIIH